jgi:hypothetical protein
MPRTRDLARIDYSKLNAKGFDSDSFEMDVLNLSDPNSDLFDQSEARYEHVKDQDYLVYSIPITTRPNKMFNNIWRQLFIF